MMYMHFLCATLLLLFNNFLSLQAAGIRSSCDYRQSHSTQKAAQSCVVDNVIHKINPVHIPPSLSTSESIYPEIKKPNVNTCEIRPLNPSDVYPAAITRPITEPIDHQAKAAEYYVIGISLGGYGILGPILTPAILVGTGGYILFKIIKDAKRKADKKQTEREFEEEQNKNSGGGGPEKPDDDLKKKLEDAIADATEAIKKKKGLNKKQQAELDKQKRYPAQNEPVGDKGVYEDAGYHHPNSQGAKSPAPKNGQKALNNSIIVKEKGNNNYQRRVGISDGEIVVLDETGSGKFHGHVRTWKEICYDTGSKDLKKILLDNGLVDKKGNILCH